MLNNYLFKKLKRDEKLWRVLSVNKLTDVD